MYQCIKRETEIIERDANCPFLTGLPAAQRLEIENGIQVELRFEPVCSNVCHLILHVVNIGNSTQCDVILFDISEVSSSNVIDFEDVLYMLNPE